LPVAISESLASQKKQTAGYGYSSVDLSPISCQLVLIEHTLDSNRDKGLALWSETFDRLFVEWDISNCRRLLRMIKQSRNSPDTGIESQVIGLSAQGMLEIHLGNSNEAIECYKKALACLQREGSGRETEGAWLWSNLGNIYYLSGDFKDATESYSRSVQLYEEAGDEKGLALALSNQGNVFRDSGEMEKALACYQQSITWLQTHAEGEYLAITLANLGTVLQLRGTWDEAEAAYRQALELFTQRGNLHYQVQVLGSLGILFLEANQLDRALDFFSRDLEVNQDLGDLLSQSQTLNNLAIVYRRKQNANQAQRCYEGSLEIKREIGDQPGELSTLINYCSLLQEIGGLENLHKVLTRARTLALLLNDTKQLSRIEALERETFRE